jgi:hypothetical protein
MRRLAVFAVSFSFLFFTLPVIAQENKEEQPPAGMEYLQITEGYRVLVPKGTQMIKTGAAVAPERIDAYAARKFQETEGRLKNIEDELFQLKGQIEQLKAGLARIEEQLSKASGK